MTIVRSRIPPAGSPRFGCDSIRVNEAGPPQPRASVDLGASVL